LLCEEIASDTAKSLILGVSKNTRKLISTIKAAVIFEKQTETNEHCHVSQKKYSLLKYYLPLGLHIRYYKSTLRFLKIPMVSLSDQVLRTQKESHPVDIFI